MNQNKLSADPLTLVLGILALIFGFAGCCCYGVTAVIPLIMAIIGLVTANKSLRDYAENPEVYSSQSRSNVNTAKIINIIAIVMNGIIVVTAIAAIAFYGTMLSSGMLEDFKNKNIEDEDFYNSEIESDTMGIFDEDTYIIDDDSIKKEEKEEKSFDEILKEIDSKY